MATEEMHDYKCLLLPSIPGRLLLLDEYNARIDQLNGRYKEAADKIVDLSGIYLDVDSRNDLKEADKLCRELIKQGSGDLAIQVASVVMIVCCREILQRTDCFFLMLCVK